MAGGPWSRGKAQSARVNYLISLTLILGHFFALGIEIRVKGQHKVRAIGVGKVFGGDEDKIVGIGEVFRVVPGVAAAAASGAAGGGTTSDAGVWGKEDPKELTGTKFRIRHV